MADTLFIIFIVYCAYTFLSESYKNFKYNRVTTRDINKYHREHIALKHKHRSKLPAYDKNGNLYTAAKQFADKAGVYSEEFDKEHKELKESIFGK